MIDTLIAKKMNNEKLDKTEFYEVIEYLLDHGVDTLVKRFFVALDIFGMTRKEVLCLTLAMRDSGRVLDFDDVILEKHSTGGVGDSSSMVLIPLMASLGYKMIKTTARSFVFTNGSADRFGAIPNFKQKLTEADIKKALDETGACVLSHAGDMVPADSLLYKLRENEALSSNLNFLAASIASKKLASGANVVLVDVKYGDASIVKTYFQALHLAKLLKYIFDNTNVKSVIEITSTEQTFGDRVGNAAEVVDAVEVLKGRQCFLREVVIQYAVDLMRITNKKLNVIDAEQMVVYALDSGSAYQKFLDIVKEQGGDVNAIKKGTFFKPKHTLNYVSERFGYVGSIDSKLLGEVVRDMCKITHDNNIGIKINVKIGQFVHKGDTILTIYYSDEKDMKKFLAALEGSVRVTEERIDPAYVLKKVIY